MKKFTLLVLLGVAIFLGLSTQASASSAANKCEPAFAGGSDVGPWPFGLEQPFPWRSIQGIWAAEIDGCEYHFIFKVSKQEGRSTQLRVHQMNVADCSLVAEGVGFEQDRIVRAQLMGKRGPQELKIHVFRPDDVPEGVSQDAFADLNRNVVVMTLAPLGRPTNKSAHQMYKLSTDVKKACEL